jgi:hypothetical protein
MMDRTVGNVMLVGFHKIAAERGDGLLPELVAMIAERRRQHEDEMLILHGADTIHHSRKAGEKAANVIAFRRHSTPACAQD